MNPNTNVDEITAKVKQSNGIFATTRDAIAKVIVGQDLLIERLLIALLTDGHILLEGVPGLAKTLAMTTLAKATQCDFKRIQFTPDLLPADLIGTTVYNPKEGTFSVRKGPIFTHIVLADEINRAPAKVQAALLEVMQERQVTIGGETFATGTPYLVVATQNPIEQEGTYPLPEAQVDRFLMKVRLTYPSFDQEREIVQRWGHIGRGVHIAPVITAQEIVDARAVVDRIYVDPKVTDYLLTLVFASRFPRKFGVYAEGLIEYGASPRASIALKICAQALAFLQGRGYVTPQDIKNVAHDVLRHRIRLSFEGEAQELTPDALIDRILSSIPVP